MQRRKLFVQLGRYGDIINILPILKAEADSGNRPILLVAYEYKDIMDGVSYADVVVFKEPFQHLLPAMRYAETLASVNDWEVVVTQVYGHGYAFKPQCDSFAKDAWKKATYLAAWDRLPLVFDKRDRSREEKLAEGLPEKPILVATHGNSSPFPQSRRLYKALSDKWPGRVVLLDDIQAHRVYDLLGLYDRAAVLVSIDTMHQHLAIGSKVPVIALTVRRPTPWHGAPERRGQVLRFNYGEYHQREAELIEAVRLRAGDPAPPKEKQSRSTDVYHVFADYDAEGDARRRNEFASATWDHVIDVPIGDMPRNATTELGYPRALPFVRDMVKEASRRMIPDDILVLTNTDTCFADDLARVIRKVCRKHGACFAHRHDFHKLSYHLSNDEIGKGKWYPGSDLFAFTGRWILEHFGEYPDMLLGAEYVDCVLRQLIKKHGGAELVHAIYHERHASAWERPGLRQVDGANCWNRKHALRWFEENGTNDRDPWDAPCRYKFAV